MKFKDLLSKDRPIYNVFVRRLSDGSLYGACGWNGERLISWDGESYDPDWEIAKTEKVGHSLIVYTDDVKENKC